MGPYYEGSGVDYETFRIRLMQQRSELEALGATAAEAEKPVELDQSRVGRLSRMDAMQAQAMSLAAKRRREIQLKRIASALQRIGEGGFGDCLRCGEPIEAKRLDYDPAVLLCIDCAAEAEC